MKKLLALLLAAWMSASLASNDFYNASGAPSQGAALVSATIRNEFANIGIAFNKMPGLTGNANQLVVVNAGGTGLSSIASSSIPGLQIGANIEAWSAQLDAIAALATNGVVSRTGANTFAARTITGTASQITITNGDGVAGAPTIALASNTALPGAPTAATAAIGTNTTQIATTAFVQSSIPSGVIFEFAGTVAPSGFLLCDGSAVSRATYATLFAAVGTTWGAGDGSTTFNVPDFRRRVAVGSGGSGSGTLGNAVGNTGGEETHTQSIAEMPAHNHGGGTGGQSADHTHSFTLYGSPGGTVLPVGNSTGGSIGAAGTSGTSNDHTHSISSQGGGTAFNQMQPSAVVLKIIKY